MNKTKTIRRELHTPGALRIRRREGDEGESRIIEGYAILFDTPSDVMYADEDTEVREVIDPQAVTRDLLDASDIKFTMFHDRQLILARSNKGAGTLSYDVDEKGVSFFFEAPATADGDKALELVRRGDLAGCSFAFSTCYYDSDYVERNVEMEGARKLVTYRVKVITGIYDFTLAADPAYPDTTVDLREIMREGVPIETEDDKPLHDEGQKQQLRDLRRLAATRVFD